jgi:Ca2+-binding RTX toxin-like protein
MNMISTGAFHNEMDASIKQQELVKKLTVAWEKKNSKVARAGGVSLMALSLAACGSEDTTPFSQADVDAAVAAVDITSDNAPLIEAAAAAEAAQAAAEADAAEALVAQAAAEAAQAAAEADAAAALVAQAAAEADAAAALLAQAEAEAAATTAQAAQATAEAAQATAEASLAAFNTQVTDAGFADLDALIAAQDALANPTPISDGTFTAAATTEALRGVVGADDTFIATNLTMTANETLIDGSNTDNDTLTFNVTAAPTHGLISGIENVVYNVTSFAAVTLDAANITGASNITVNNLQTSGTTAGRVDNVETGTTVTAGSGVTGTLTVNSDAGATVTANGGATATTVTMGTVTTGAATIVGGTATTTATGTATTGSVTISGDALTNITGTGATVNATFTTTGTTTAPLTLATTGTAGAVDSHTIVANGNVTYTNGNTIETTTLSGGTAAATYTMGALAAGGDIVVSGDQNVTIAGAKASFHSSGTTAATTRSITDSSTATSTLQLTDTVAATANLISAGVDTIEQNGVLVGGATLQLANGADVNVTGTQAQVLTLSRGTATTTAADTTDTVSVSLDGAATAVLVTSDSSTATTEQAFNTVNFSSNGTAAGTLTATLGNLTGNLNLAGGTALTLAAASTANLVDASDMTAALTATVDTLTTDNITGGAGDDNITVVTGGTVTVDGGAGSNTLVLTGDVDSVTASNFGTLSIAGNITSADTSLFSGSATVVTAAAGRTINFNTVAANYDIPAVDLSGLVLNNITSFTADATNGLAPTLYTSNTGMSWEGSSVIDNVTGTANADVLNGNAGDDVLSGGAGADTLSGGAGADGLTGGAGHDTMTGGAGIDTFTGNDGNDTINIADDASETTAVRDLVVLTHSGSGNVDTTSGFDADGDGVQIGNGNIVDAGGANDTLSNMQGADIGGAIAAGAMTTADVAANTAGVTQLANAANLIVFTSTTSTSFATAIGSSTLVDTAGSNTAGLAVNEGVAASWYDSTNSQAVIGYIEDTNATGTALTSADTFHEMVRLDMVSTDYTSANIDAIMEII